MQWQVHHICAIVQQTIHSEQPHYTKHCPDICVDLEGKNISGYIFHVSRATIKPTGHSLEPCRELEYAQYQAWTLDLTPLEYYFVGKSN